MSQFSIYNYCNLLSEPNCIKPPFGWVGHVPFAFFIVNLIKPGLLVELGVHTGNSYNAFCQAVKELELDTICYGVDTWQGDEQAGLYKEDIYCQLYNYQINHYSAFSNLLKMTFDEALDSFSEGSLDLLHIDGFHTYEAVKHDFEAWLPKMKADGVVILHDISERSGDFGVWKLWDEVKEKYTTIEFTHSHGLGIVFLGYKNEKVKQFILDFNEEAFIKLLFQHTGSSIKQKVELQENNMALESAIKEMTQEIEQKNQEIFDIINSESWKLTAPIRLAGQLFRKAIKP